MAAPALAHPSPAPAYARMYLRDVYEELRPDLPSEVIDHLVDRTISVILKWGKPQLPADAYLP